MFDIGWSELLVIGVVALVVIGPKELPAVLRSLGQWMAKIRRMASDFQNQFQDAMREAELADVKKQFDDITTAKDYGLSSITDPFGAVKTEIEGAIAAADKPAAPVASVPAPVKNTGTPATDAVAIADAALPAAAPEPGASATSVADRQPS